MNTPQLKTLCKMIVADYIWEYYYTKVINFFISLQSVLKIWNTFTIWQDKLRPRNKIETNWEAQHFQIKGNSTTTRQTYYALQKQNKIQINTKKVFMGFLLSFLAVFLQFFLSYKNIVSLSN